MENCPYCGCPQQLNNDGEQYEEYVLHEHECTACEKIFTFNTYISFSYEAYKADCLNGGDHKYIPTHTCPIEATKMRCIYCEDKIEPTEDEWKNIYKRRNNL